MLNASWHFNESVFDLLTLNPFSNVFLQRNTYFFVLWVLKPYTHPSHFSKFWSSTFRFRSQSARTLTTRLKICLGLSSTLSVFLIRLNSPLKALKASWWRYWKQKNLQFHEWGSTHRFSRKLHPCHLMKISYNNDPGLYMSIFFKYRLFPYIS